MESKRGRAGKQGGGRATEKEMNGKEISKREELYGTTKSRQLRTKKTVRKD